MALYFEGIQCHLGSGLGLVFVQSQNSSVLKTRENVTGTDMGCKKGHTSGKRMATINTSLYNKGWT
jgi:hypothetical protein